MGRAKAVNPRGGGTAQGLKISEKGPEGVESRAAGSLQRRGCGLRCCGARRGRLQRRGRRVLSAAAGGGCAGSRPRGRLVQEAVEGELGEARSGGLRWRGATAAQHLGRQAAAAPVHGLHSGQAHHTPGASAHARRGAGKPDVGGDKGRGRGISWGSGSQDRWRRVCVCVLQGLGTLMCWGRTH